MIVEQKTPEQSCGEEDGCLCCQPRTAALPVPVWALAEGRDAYGVLVNAPEQTVRQPEQAWQSGHWLQRAKASTAAECQSIVELFGAEHGADLILYDNLGWSFDELFGAEMQEAWDARCRARRAIDSAQRAAEEARIAAHWQKCVVEQAQVEARRNLRRGEVVQKNGRICTRCYSCEGDKNTEWEDGGKRARPSTLHVSSECFTHREFLAGRIRDDCPFLHQGDKGWHAQWSTNLLWDPEHPQVMPVARHIRQRRNDDKIVLCISEKSAGYLPIHLGGRAEGMDARTWRGQAQTPNRFAAAAASVGGGGSAAAAAPSRWAALAGPAAVTAADVHMGALAVEGRRIETQLKQWQREETR
jgi:hypothetical protein